ncbi:MAG: hypothetical protein AB7I52_17485 [Rhizobiaceae bacterium]
MTKRYQYARMTPADFGADLNALKLTANDFARISGARYERVEKWLRGQEDIPPHVPVLTALLGLPGGIAKALQVVQFYVEKEGDDAN